MLLKKLKEYWWFYLEIILLILVCAIYANSPEGKTNSTVAMFNTVGWWLVGLVAGKTIERRR